MPVVYQAWYKIWYTPASSYFGTTLDHKIDFDWDRDRKFCERLAQVLFMVRNNDYIPWPGTAWLSIFF